MTAYGLSLVFAAIAGIFLLFAYLFAMWKIDHDALKSLGKKSQADRFHNYSLASSLYFLVFLVSGIIFATPV